jgi:hypothetical protein
LALASPSLAKYWQKWRSSFTVSNGFFSIQQRAHLLPRGNDGFGSFDQFPKLILLIENQFVKIFLTQESAS